MRVKVMQDVRLYWNYAIHEFEKGSEHIGELARHLLENTREGTVKVVDDAPEKPKQQPVRDPAGPEDVGSEPEGDGGSDGGEPPVEGTIDALMAWVDGDQDRAAAALAAEQAKDKPRSTVVKRLTALADADEQ